MSDPTGVCFYGDLPQNNAYSVQVELVPSLLTVGVIHVNVAKHVWINSTIH